MKKHGFSLSFVLLLIMAVSQPRYAAAQSKKDSIQTAAVKEMVSGQRYTFRAQNVTPLGGRLRQLSNNDELRVTKDQISSDLPYFGRAYNASPGSSGGIQFTSKDFAYSISNKKKDGWNVVIQFKDAQDVKQMQLSIFSNGSASLQVLSNNRQSISFNGYIAAPDKNK